MSKGIQFLQKLFVILVLSSTVLSGAIIQTELKNNQWQLIGFMGAYGTAQSSLNYRQDQNVEIFDIADAIGMPSYFVSPTSGSQLVGTGTATVNNNVNELNSSISIFAIRNTLSVSGKTKLTAAPASAVNFKIGNAKTLNSNLPRFRMYIKGKSKPAIRVDYQADYEGQVMRIKFGDEIEDYVAYFNHRNTYSNPYVLDPNKKEDDVESASSDIQDAIDFNTTDNNLTNMLINNIFTIKDTAGVYNKDLTDFSASPKYQAIAYRFSSIGTWETFNSKNAEESSNEFTKFDTGRGYWLKIQNDDNESTGLISTDTAKLTKDVYKNIKNEWNLLSFKDKELRYSFSGIFIPDAVLISAGEHPTLYFGSHGSDSSDAFSRLVLDSREYGSSTVGVARAINIYSQARNDIYGAKQNIRAFPAMRPNLVGGTVGAEDAGVIIIADTLFEINSSNSTIVTLAGNPLTDVGNGYRSSVYGEYMNIADFGDLEFNSTTESADINASVTISMPKYNSAPMKVTDLNLSSRNKTMLSILDGFKKAATKNGATTASTMTSGYLVDVDFNRSGVYETFTEADLKIFSSMFFVSGARYSISDTTYAKAYIFNAHGKFNVVSSKGSTSIAVTDTNDSNITPTINAINAQKLTTGVYAIDLGMTGTDMYFALTSAEPGIDILENDSENLFEDVSLTSSSIPNARRIKGAIGSVYSIKDILETPIDVNTTLYEHNQSINAFHRIFIDGNTSKSIIGPRSLLNTFGEFNLNGQDFPSVSTNLQSNPVWVLDFPIEGGIIETIHNAGKDIRNIMTMESANNKANDTFWRVTDLTKPLNTLYGNSYDSDTEYDNDYQGIFHVYPNKAYWVLLGNKEQGRPTNIRQILEKVENSVTLKASAHFSNTFKDGLSTTQNHINSSLNVIFNGRLKINDYYNVVAIISGKRYYLKKTGNIFQLNINDNDMPLVAKAGPNKANDSVFLEVYDGEGLNIIEKTKTGNSPSINKIIFYKPTTPTVKWNPDNGFLVAQGVDGNTFPAELYTFPISDIESERKKKRLESNNLRDAKNKSLSWNFDSNDSLKGGLSTVRVLIKSKDNFYSDIKAIMYAPIDKGHVLRSYKQGNNIVVGSIPYSYIQNQFLTLHNPKENDKTKNPTFTYVTNTNGEIATNGVNGGVQLALLGEGAKTNSDIRIAYYPEGNEGSKALNGLAPNGIRTMFLRVNQSPTNAKAIAKLTYIPDYEGKLFYISFNKKLYQGRFSKTNNFENDGSSYNLEAADIKIDSLIINNQIQAIEIGGRSISSDTVQPMAVPLSMTNGGGGGNNNPTPKPDPDPKPPSLLPSNADNNNGNRLPLK